MSIKEALEIQRRCSAGEKFTAQEGAQAVAALRKARECGPEIYEAAAFLLSLHDDAVFICGVDDERKVYSALDKLRTVLTKAEEKP